MLADSLPDHFGNQLLQKWLHKMGHQTRTLNPVAQLCFVGDRGMGALEFKPVRYQSSKDTDRTLGLQQLVALANDFLGNRISFSQLNLFGSTIDDLKHLLKVGTSAGGARPKAIVSYSPIPGALKAGLVANEPGFEDWLLKFDGVGKKKEAIDDLGRLEYAYYKMVINTLSYRQLIS